MGPDYVLVPRNLQEKLAKAFKKAYASFYPEGALKSPDTARIISPLHYNRIMGLVAATKGNIVTGGTGDGKKIDITVVGDVLVDDALLQQYVLQSFLGTSLTRVFREIFGPVLSIVPVDSIDEALKIIQARYVEHFFLMHVFPITVRHPPLAVYLFSDDSELKQKCMVFLSFYLSHYSGTSAVIHATRSGALMINDTVQHVASESLEIMFDAFV